MSDDANSRIVHLIIEDREQDRREIINVLSDEGFNPDFRLEAEFKEDALTELSANAERLDVVFLDLNIPLNCTDTRPERDNGRSILKMIHQDFNRRPRVDIKVVIISGEDIHDGCSRDTLMDAYRGTILTICQKTDLARILKNAIKRFHRDPVRSSLRRANSDLEESYTNVVYGTGPIRNRLEDAKDIIRWLLACDLEYTQNNVGVAQRYGDKISDLVKAVLAARFMPDGEFDPNPSIRLLKPGTTWKDNPWRGVMIQHIRSIYLYRNSYAHIAERPYNNAEGHTWTPDQTHLTECQEGKAVASIVAEMTKDLLRWLLPWHQAVYIPWRERLPR